MNRPVRGRGRPPFQGDDRTLLEWIDPLNPNEEAAALTERALAARIERANTSAAAEDALELYFWREDGWAGLTAVLRAGNVPDRVAARVADLIEDRAFNRHRKPRASEKAKIVEATSFARFAAEVLNLHYSSETGVRRRACELAEVKYGISADKVQDFWDQKRGDTRRGRRRRPPES